MTVGTKGLLAHQYAIESKAAIVVREMSDLSWHELSSWLELKLMRWVELRFAWLVHEDDARLGGQCPHVAMGMLGLNQKILQTEGWSQLLNAWVNCSLHSECIAPSQASLQEHKFDQSVFSTLLFSSPNVDFRLTLSETYWFDWAWAKSANAETADVAFFSRRYHCPKPYSRHAKKKISQQTSLSSDNEIENFLQRKEEVELRRKETAQRLLTIIERPPASTDCGWGVFLVILIGTYFLTFLFAFFILSIFWRLVEGRKLRRKFYQTSMVWIVFCPVTDNGRYWQLTT